jgi:hypothetical protein
VGHPSGSVFAWFIFRSVSLGFFSGSGVFPLGFGGPVGVLGLVSVLLRALLYSQVSFWGFSYFVEVSNMLVRGFLVGFLWVFLGFLWVS